MKMKTVVASAFAITMLASCANGSEPSSSKPDTSKDYETVLNGFEKEVKGTAKITYDAKYKVDVISEKGGMDGFKHDVDDKTVAEFDLTEGDLYLYVKRDAKEPSTVETPVTREALLYKDGAKYKYVTTVMENPVELANEAAARAKVDELLERISGNLAGYVDTTSFIYAKDNAYEHKEFGLSTGNITAEDFMEAPTYANNDANGLKITNSLDYVGYHTDAGISDFEGHDGKPASTYEVNTNEKGYVTSYTQSIDSQCVMNIMTPAPTVTIKGTKAATAKYGETLTKKTEITHQLTTTKLIISDMTQGSVETFMAPTVDGTKTPVAAGADLTVGQFLAVKVTPAGSNTIKMVTFANSSKDVAEADGYFYFEIPEGKANLTVNFIGSDVIEGIQHATTAWTATADVTSIKLTPFTMTMDAPAPVYDDPVAVGADIIVGKFVRIEPTMAEGKELGKITVNDKVIELNFGQYFFEAKEAKTYTIVVTAKVAGEVEVAPTLSYPAAFVGGTAKVGSFSFATGAPVFTPLANGAEIPEGSFVCVIPTPDEGNTIKSVKVNGKDPAQVKNGMYTFSTEKGKENKVELLFEGTNLSTKAITKYTPVEGVTLKVTPFTIAGQGAPAYDDEVAIGAEIELNKYVQLDATVADGKTCEIFVNGTKLAPGFGGKIFFQAKVAGTYEIVITTKAAA